MLSLVYFFPFSLLNQAMHFVYLQSASGPTFSLIVRRLVQEPSDLIDAACRGDVETTRRLFKLGLNAPNDAIAETGKTALQVGWASRSQVPSGISIEIQIVRGRSR